MNKQTIAVILAAALFSSGCATFQYSPNAQAAITAAAALGTSYDLMQRPSDLPYFVAAEQELYIIANSTNTVSAKNIEAALEQAGQTNKFVNSALITGINLANGFIQSNQSTNTQSLNIACGWLADGIAQSVGTQLKGLKKAKK